VKDTTPRAQLRQLVEGYWASQVVGVAARLALADHLARGPMPLDELAEVTGAHPGALSRLLRACAAIGLTELLDGGAYALTPLGACLRSGERSLRHVAIAFTGPAFWLPWGRLCETVQTGLAAAPETLGCDLYAYLERNPAEGACFGAAMAEETALVGHDLVARYDVSRFTRIVDIGGGLGELLAVLLAASPAATGVLFDRPDVVPGAREALAARGFGDRVQVVGGDFFSDVPPRGDLYVLKGVLCDWGEDEQATRILRNCWRAAARDSSLLVIDPIPAGGEPSRQDLGDLACLVTAGGHPSRPMDEYRRLLEEAGYGVTGSLPLPGGMTVVEARRSDGPGA